MKTMKKVLVLLAVSLFTMSMSAQTDEVTASIYQDVNTIFDNFAVSIELDLNSESNMNYAVGFSILQDGNLQNVSFSTGYNLSNGFVTITPSIKGAWNKAEDNYFSYGGDLDIDIKISRALSLTSKTLFMHSGKEQIHLEGFKPVYLAGLKVIL